MTWFLYSLVLLLPMLAGARDDRLPPIPTPAADVIRAETAYQAFLRSSAARSRGNDLVHVGGNNVTVYATSGLPW
jgi:hypothetical protein